MEVILLERIEKLGQMGDVVSVRPGFARNFLLPQKKALRANKANLAFFETQRADLEARNLEQRKEAEAVAAKMDGVQVIIVRQAGESGQLYGSVSARDIAAALIEEGFKTDRNQVNLNAPIKEVGRTEVRVRLHPEVSVNVLVNVARSAEEAEQQATAAELLEKQEDVAELEALGAEVEEEVIVEEVVIEDAPAEDEETA